MLLLIGFINIEQNINMIPRWEKYFVHMISAITGPSQVRATALHEC